MKFDYLPNCTPFGPESRATEKGGDDDDATNREFTRVAKTGGEREERGGEGDGAAIKNR